ncbi:hypothetical protein MNL08_06825 [Bartonella krasnovii]|uniref:hypothetical protein n=1 Tax=Bartonella krasnovii TaxID=2267275 RepID=UPI001F4C6DC9|nr:hypothetical protein [Bartonella krasnovii]UNF41878.1 hypothetical protein MNL08_06825 [Bartonella krasnovii]UNF55084.1 hypothetical protein MNL00_06835 [Bartonella krasnovii]
MIKINGATSGGKDKQIFETSNHKRGNAPIPLKTYLNTQNAHNLHRSHTTGICF